MHACCMLERADRFANRYADPRSRVVCRSKWRVGSRPPHPAELARGLPMTTVGEEAGGYEGRPILRRPLLEEHPRTGADQLRDM